MMESKYFTLYDISCAALALLPMVVVGVFLALCIVAVCPHVSALDAKTATVIQYDGATPILNSLTAKSDGDKISTLGDAAKAAFTTAKYPYTVSSGKIEIAILKIAYNKEYQMQGYYIEATRDGDSVKVDNPIWIYPAPLLAKVSEVEDAKANTLTVTLKEDPKLAAEQVLIRYVSMQPVGKA